MVDDLHPLDNYLAQAEAAIAAFGPNLPPGKYRVTVPEFAPDTQEWSPLTDEEAEAQMAASVELAEAAEFWDDEEEASSALYRSRRRLRDYVLTARELDKIPPVTWLVDGVLPEDAFAMMYAAPGAGKTFVALDWAMHLASGVETWEDRPLRRGSRVLYIYAEGAPGLRKRRDAWEAHHNLQITDNLWFIIRAANFMARQDATGDDDWTELLSIAQELQPKLIVVDTMSRSIPGEDENDQGMGSFLVNRVEDLREACGWGTLMFLHHTNAAGTRERGTTTIRGACNTMIAIHEDSLVRVTKQRDDQEPLLGKLELVEVEGTGSVVPVYTAVEDDGPDNDTIRRYQILTAIRENPGQTATALHKIVGGGKGVLVKILDTLVSEGTITATPAGRSKIYYPRGDP